MEAQPGPVSNAKILQAIPCWAVCSTAMQPELQSIRPLRQLEPRNPGRVTFSESPPKSSSTMHAQGRHVCNFCGVAEPLLCSRCCHGGYDTSAAQASRQHSKLCLSDLANCSGSSEHNMTSSFRVKHREECCRWNAGSRSKALQQTIALSMKMSAPLRSAALSHISES